jgi:uncharacterized protein
MPFESLLLALAAASPSFPCDGPLTAVETMVCTDPELAVRDRAMGQIYRSVPPVFPLVFKAQRRWLAERNTCRTRQCLMRAYDGRIVQLASAGRISEPLRHEDYVGSLSIAPVEGDWYVFLVGNAASDAKGKILLAEAAGVVRMADGAGRWRLSPQCSLAIARAGTLWRVAQDPGCARLFHGLSVSGLYLTEKEYWGTPAVKAGAKTKRRFED